MTRPLILISTLLVTLLSIHVQCDEPDSEKKELNCYIDLDCIPLAPKGYFCCKSEKEKDKLMKCCKDCKRTKFPEESCNLKQPFPVWAVLCGCVSMILIIGPGVFLARRHYLKQARTATAKESDDEEEGKAKYKRKGEEDAIEKGSKDKDSKPLFSDSNISNMLTNVSEYFQATVNVDASKLPSKHFPYHGNV